MGCMAFGIKEGAGGSVLGVWHEGKEHVLPGMVGGGCTCAVGV